MNGSSLQAVGLSELFHGGQHLFRRSDARRFHVARCDAAVLWWCGRAPKFSKANFAVTTPQRKLAKNAALGCPGRPGNAPPCDGGLDPPPCDGGRIRVGMPAIGAIRS